MEKELTKAQKQEILDRIGSKAEPVEKIFDSLRDMTMGILEVNNKMLSTIADLESENKLLREWKESAFTVFKEWDKVSDYIKPRCRLGDKYTERALELFKMIDAENKSLREEIERLMASQLTEFTEDELKNLFAGYNHFFYTPNEYFSDKGKQIKHDVRKKIEYISKTVLFPDLNV